MNKSGGDHINLILNYHNLEVLFYIPEIFLCAAATLFLIIGVVTRSKYDKLTLPYQIKYERIG